MKLYFHPMSGNSRRVLLVASHLDIELEHVLVDLTKAEQREVPHVARNPNAKVPVLDDDGFLLWESRAIMMYLADKTPGQTLLPTDLQARADVTRWLFWCAAHMALANTILVQENFVKVVMGRGQADLVEVARGEALVRQFAAILDAHLANRTWVSPDRVTLADYSLAASFALAVPARLPIEPYVHLRSWLGRIAELDAWTQTATPQR